MEEQGAEEEEHRREITLVEEKKSQTDADIFVIKWTKS